MPTMSSSTAHMQLTSTKIKTIQHILPTFLQVSGNNSSYCKKISYGSLYRNKPASYPWHCCTVHPPEAVTKKQHWQKILGTFFLVNILQKPRKKPSFSRQVLFLWNTSCKAVILRLLVKSRLDHQSVQTHQWPKRAIKFRGNAG